MNDHTAEQIRDAQQAGNKAWARAYALGKDPEQCADAYRDALNAEYALMDRHYSVNPAVTLQQAAPLGTAKAAQFAAHVAGLSAEDIAQMERMTAETANEAPSHDGMWK
jgi:hypothetical protein